MYKIVNRHGEFLLSNNVPYQWSPRSALCWKLHDEAKQVLEKMGPIARRITGAMIRYEAKP